MTADRVFVVGAGAGGLAAAIDLARCGAEVTVFERAAEAGGKIRQVRFGDAAIDSGPTVFTMRWVFEQLFDDAGANLDDSLTLKPMDILARHAWRQGGRLDLFADRKRSAAAIGDFAGAEDARGYEAFCRDGTVIFQTLCDRFMCSQRAAPLEVVRRVGLFHLPAFTARIKAMTTLWKALGHYFKDPRLRQLFGRYATYIGSSPFATPATMMLVAHVEQDGVWTVEGGMLAVAAALQSLGEGLGVAYRFNSGVAEILCDGGRACGVVLDDGERLMADAVIFNGDISALGHGLLGSAAREAGRITPRARRSLSAVTWSLLGRTEGFPLSLHNVFFNGDYRQEFDAIFNKGTIADSPTVYLFAPDRADASSLEGPERLFVLINAPPNGDSAGPCATPVDALRTRTFDLLSACGLDIAATDNCCVTTTPADFHRRFPATGGALYGQSSHGVVAALARAGARTRLPGLYLAGGSVHPGPGIPMSVMSGRLAAAQYAADRSA